MKFKFSICALLLAALSPSFAQVASHAPTMPIQESGDKAAMDLQRPQAVGKPVVRVNGTVLTDRDLLHEMYAIFPYAQQHNGFPKSLESEIRSGAKEMIVFEELVYQEAERRKMTVAPERLNRAEADLRKQLGSQQMFDQYLQAECNGSRQVMRQKIRRSMLIDAMLKIEVAAKARPTLVELRNYYDKNPAQFTHAESFRIQTISIIPPAKASPEIKKEARKHADDASKAAKLTKNFQEFGLLAEKYSDDDYHVKLGDHNYVDRDKLPPPVVTQALTMKEGQVSDLIQLGDNYTIFRLVSHHTAGKDSFESVKESLRKEIEKIKYNALRSDLNKRLKKTAKVEEL
jgi:peptidyl-prolyl cis-trans isomerase SurA